MSLLNVPLKTDNVYKKKKKKVMNCFKDTEREREREREREINKDDVRRNKCTL